MKHTSLDTDFKNLQSDITKKVEEQSKDAKDTLQKQLDAKDALIAQNAETHGKAIDAKDELATKKEGEYSISLQSEKDAGIALCMRTTHKYCMKEKKADIKSSDMFSKDDTSLGAYSDDDYFDLLPAQRKFDTQTQCQTEIAYNCGKITEMPLNNAGLLANTATDTPAAPTTVVVEETDAPATETFTALDFGFTPICDLNTLIGCDAHNNTMMP